MESDFRKRASESLAQISEDRERLAASIKVPPTIPLLAGALAACFVASALVAFPDGKYDPPFWPVLPIILSVPLISVLARMQTGIEFGQLGVRGVVLWICATGVVLVGYCVAVALMTLDLEWAVVVVAAMAFASNAALSFGLYRSLLEQLRRG